jgi:hypothetical protein
MSFGRFDPGPCAVCGQAHSACTADSGPSVMVQLPQRDAAAAPVVAEPVPVVTPPVQFTTSTYRGKKKTP